uniref:Uncharacterized protein n=1 Tax=Arundo donax TaxID=35708 RepID=A0A0A9FEV0_ARUDO
MSVTALHRDRESLWSRRIRATSAAAASPRSTPLARSTSVRSGQAAASAARPAAPNPLERERSTARRDGAAEAEMAARVASVTRGQRERSRREEAG